MQRTKDALARSNGHSPVVTVKGLLSQEGYKKRFEEILGKKANGFMASIVNLVNSDFNFKETEPNSVIASAVIAATLDLPIDRNLGFAYIIPYKDKKVSKAQFQLGYKGLIQLAIRTGQYRRLTVAEIYEGQFISFNSFTGSLKLNEDETGWNFQNVVGYAAYFELTNGFEHTIYWSKKRVEEHAKRYSKSYGSDYSPWKKNFDEMAKKTVIKQLLSKFGILSIEMQTLQTALTKDQAILDDHGEVETYPDAPEAFDVPFASKATPPPQDEPPVPDDSAEGGLFDADLAFIRQHGTPDEAAQAEAALQQGQPDDFDAVLKTVKDRQAMGYEPGSEG
jgi:recombination protein RecT